MSDSAVTGPSQLSTVTDNLFISRSLHRYDKASSRLWKCRRAGVANLGLAIALRTLQLPCSVGTLRWLSLLALVFSRSVFWWLPPPCLTHGRFTRNRDALLVPGFQPQCSHRLEDAASLE